MHEIVERLLDSIKCVLPASISRSKGKGQSTTGILPRWRCASDQSLTIRKPKAPIYFTNGRMSICVTSKISLFESCESDKCLGNFYPLNIVYSDNCKAKECATLVNKLFATGGMNHADMKSFLQTFLIPYYETFLRCPPSPEPNHSSFAHVILFICSMCYISSLVMLDILVGKEILYIRYKYILHYVLFNLNLN